MMNNKNLLNELKEKNKFEGRFFNIEDTKNIKEAKEFYVPDEDDVNFGRLLELKTSKGKIYRHFKGDLYLLIDIAEHTETGDDLVIYKALYGDCKVYARPLKMFLERVPEDKLNPTGQEYRLELYTGKSVKED